MASKNPVIDFAVIGAQKSASTFVQRALEDHPELCIAAREPWIFEDPYYSPEAVSDFFGRLRDKSSAQLVGFKRPDLFGLPEAAERLSKAAPAMKLIAILRNPIDRAIAGYFHFIRYGILPLRPAEEGLTAILNGQMDDEPNATKVLEYGRYGEHLQRYVELFSREQLHVRRQEDFAADARKEMRNIYRFLGIDERHESRFLKSRPQSSVYSLARLRFLRLRSPLVFRWNAGRTRYTHRKFTRPIWYGFEAIDRWLLSHVFGNEKPVLSKQLKDRLRDYYREDLQLADDLSGIDLSHWSKD